MRAAHRRADVPSPSARGPAAAARPPPCRSSRSIPRSGARSAAPPPHLRPRSPPRAEAPARPSASSRGRSGRARVQHRGRPRRSEASSPPGRPPRETPEPKEKRETAELRRVERSQRLAAPGRRFCRHRRRAGAASGGSRDPAQLRESACRCSRPCRRSGTSGGRLPARTPSSRRRSCVATAPPVDGSPAWPGSRPSRASGSP